mmetsp:Transcript_2646/g.3076  ORF Transcript_2646/g.3076 Transcript_2646/m.3076 type:complete len:84 (+) Transcript_2646:502-753(+)
MAVQQAHQYTEQQSSNSLSPQQQIGGMLYFLRIVFRVQVKTTSIYTHHIIHMIYPNVCVAPHIMAPKTNNTTVMIVYVKQMGG